MKYISEFRDAALAQQLAAAIHREARPDREYRFMEFCGGHTHAISRYGIADLLPANVRLIHGPGCPVCVLPIGRIDQAIRLVLEHGVTLCTYGDCLRVPASGGMSLFKARAMAKRSGGQVRMIYSTTEALAFAQQHPDRQVVFLAIGLETTTPPTAVAIRQAAALGLKNFSVLCCHVLTPPAMRAILAQPGMAIDGIIGPAHVSTIIGSQPYGFCAAEFGKPVVISGFEPLDVMQAVRQLIRQKNNGVAQVENEFTRAVTAEGNRKAQALMAEVFALRTNFEWRGLGTLPDSALCLRDAYADFDAEKRFASVYSPIPDHRGCECGAILAGRKAPKECKLFAKACRPDNPLGACMVSSEGACAAEYTYGRLRGAEQ